jgi:hypothetical protein
MRYGPSDDERPLRIGGAARVEKTEPLWDIVDVAFDVPPPNEIARFLCVFRSLNGGDEPTPDGPLSNVWAWLGRLANETVVF